MDTHFWLHHFATASITAKAIYLLLSVLSIVSWAIMISKAALLHRTARATRSFLELYRNSRRDIPGLYRVIRGPKARLESPLVAVFSRGCEELQAFLGREPGPGGTPMRTRIGPHQFATLTRSVTAVEDKCFLDLEHLLIILATTISAAPFLGLLGTVWGILESFQAMGSQGATGVTAVGSGISEALIATAFGLVVAIPALLGYNVIGARIRELAGEADTFLADFLALIEADYVREDRL